MIDNDKTGFSSFREFYPYYLSEHRNRTSRRLHFTGTLIVIFLLVYIPVTGQFLLAFLLPVVGYGFAWVGHFFFEKNKPATFTWPVYSLIGDFVMFRDIIIGRIRL